MVATALYTDLITADKKAKILTKTQTRRITNDTAFCIIDRIQEVTGFGLEIIEDIIPKDRDTLFTCSGMQNMKTMFRNPNLTQKSNIQSCIRTDDIELVGDGTHLTYFEMIGTFGFGTNNYRDHIHMWDEIIHKLGIRRSITHITYHTDFPQSGQWWRELGYLTIPSPDCTWTDGDITGYCTEMFVGDLEIGNLVNPNGNSVDVGFGLERLVQVIEGHSRVDDTSLFRTELNPILRDHDRTLNILWKQGITPGNKGRNYVCRKLIRRVLPFVGNDHLWYPWIESERELREKSIEIGRKKWEKFKDRDLKFWWETFGILPDEIDLIRT